MHGPMNTKFTHFVCDIFTMHGPLNTKFTHFVCDNFFPSKIVPFFEIMWKYMAEPDRPQIVNIIWRMRFAMWITKATDTHSEYVILIAFSPQQWLRERASVVSLYVHCLSCVFSECNSLLTNRFFYLPNGICRTCVSKGS